MSDWHNVRISDLATIDIGGTPSRTTPTFWAEKPAGHAWISIADLKGKYIHETKEHITSLGVRSSNVKLIPEHTTVMSFKLTVGRTAITGREMFCNEAIAFFQPKDDRLHTQWLYHALPKAAMSVVTDTAVKGVTLNKAKMAKMTLNLPPPGQQIKIAQILDTLDTAIQETEALIAKLKAVKQGLLHDLLTRGIDANGELRPPQAEAPGLYKMSALGWIPREWDIESLTQVCSEIVDCPHSTPQYQDQGVLVARTMHIKDGVFLESQASRVSESQYQGRIARLKPLAGDLILTREAPVGEAFVIPLGMKICLGQRVMLLRPSNGELIADYLLAQIYSGAVKDRIAALTSGTTNPHLNVSEVKSFEIPLPGIEEQQRISEQLKSIDLRISVELQQLQKLGKEKSGLMDDLLTGRVRVTPLLPAHAEESP